jgi:hypothetical protein
MSGFPPVADNSKDFKIQIRYKVSSRTSWLLVNNFQIRGVLFPFIRSLQKKTIGECYGFR